MKKIATNDTNYTNLVCLLLLVLVGCGERPTPEATGVAAVATVTATMVTPTEMVVTVTAAPTGTARPTRTVAPTVTATPLPSSTPSPTPTETPIPLVTPPPGLVYLSEEGLRRVEARGYSVFVMEKQAGITLSPDGLRAVYEEEGEIWLVELVTNRRTMLTASEDYALCCPYWWPNRPDVLLFESQPGLQMMGMGYQTSPAVVTLEGEILRILGSQPASIGPPAISPDGNFVAFEEDGVPLVYEWGVGTAGFEVADYGFPEFGEAVISHPAWSPDGKKLAWVVSGKVGEEWEHGVGIFDLESYTSRFLSPYPIWGFDGGRSSITWSPDGRFITLAGANSDNGEDELRILDVEEGTEVYFGTNISRRAVWSPSGMWLAMELYDEGLEQWQVWVVSADGEQMYELGAGERPRWSPDESLLVFEPPPGQPEIGYGLVEVGDWERRPMDLPAGATIVDWHVFTPAELMSFWPLSPGSYWVYQYTAYGGENEATYVVTDTVETAEWLGADYVAHIVRQVAYVEGVEGLINEPFPKSYWYIARQNQLYRQDELELEAVERSWLEYVYPPSPTWFADPIARTYSDPVSGGRIRLGIESLEVPAGLFTDCAHYATYYLSGSPQMWHCPGVGMVKEQYDHRGTPFGFEMVLVDWEIGD